MSTIVLRSVKGTPLTNTEVDTNFTNLNTDKLEAATSATLTNKTINLTSNTLVATSAQLLAAITDETGTGSLVFATNPTLTGATLAGTVSGGGNQINNVIIGTTTPLAGAFTTLSATGRFEESADIRFMNEGFGIVNAANSARIMTFNNASIATSVPLAVTGALSATGNLTISGNGPNAIGGSTSVNRQFLIQGAFNASTNAYGLAISSSLTPSAGSEAALFTTEGTLNKAGSGTHADFAAALLLPPTIGAGAATLTNASTLKITGAPSAGTNNYALWVAGGNVRLDSNVGIGTSLPATPLDVTKAGGSNFVATFQNTTAATPYCVTIKDAASPTAGYPLLTITDSTGATSYLRVDSSSGHVGVNTSPTSYRFDVSHTAAPLARLQSTNANGAYLDFYNGSSTPLFIGFGATLVGSLTTSDAALRYSNNLVFSYGSTEVGRFTSGGLSVTGTGAFTGAVSVGTSSSPTKLNVYVPSSTGPVLTLGGADGIGKITGVRIGYGEGGSYMKSAILFENTDAAYSNGSLHLCVDSAQDSGNVVLADSKLTIVSGGNVGIGTTDPQAKIHAVKTEQQTDVDASAQVLLLENTSTDIAGNFTGIRFRQTNGTNAANTFIGISSTGNSATRARLVFAPPNPSGNSTERMTILSSGNAGIGTNNPQNRLQVVDTTRPQFSVSYQGTTGLYLEDSTNNSYKSWKIATSTLTGSSLEFFKSTTTSGAPTWDASPSMSLDTNGNLLVGSANAAGRIYSFTSSNQWAAYAESGLGSGLNSGVLALVAAQNSANNSYKAIVYYNAGAGQDRFSVADSGAIATAGSIALGTNGNPPTSGIGVQFPATQVASSNANTLDDYEEGTFTPSVSAASGSYTTVTATGKYVKVGRLVTIRMRVTITTNGTASGAMFLGNIPFPTTDNNDFGGGTREDVSTGLGYVCSGQGTTSIYINRYDGTYGLGNGQGLTFCISYVAD